MCRAETLALAGRRADADAAAHAAVRVAEQRGNLVGARLGRELFRALAHLQAAPRP
jgi:hypothetical protein